MVVFPGSILDMLYVPNFFDVSATKTILVRLGFLATLNLSASNLELSLYELTLKNLLFADNLHFELSLLVWSLIFCRLILRKVRLPILVWLAKVDITLL